MRKLIAIAAVAATLAVPTGAAAASSVVEVKDCPPGYVGYVVAVVDRDLVRFCIPFGP